MATSIETVIDTLRDTLQSAPLNLREIGWHGEQPGAGEMRRDGILYDLDLSSEGRLEGWSGGTVEVSQPVEIVLHAPVTEWLSLRTVETNLSDVAEDVRRVVFHRSGLEVEAMPSLEIDPAPQGDALVARVALSVRYQLAISNSAS